MFLNFIKLFKIYLKFNIYIFGHQKNLFNYLSNQLNQQNQFQVLIKMKRINIFMINLQKLCIHIIVNQYQSKIN